MARDPSFVNTIVASFVRTMDVLQTAEELNMDPDLVRYWLGKQKFDLRGQGAYRVTGDGALSQRHVSVGVVIAMLRLEQGMMKPQDLAEIAGMSVKKVAAIEKGTREVTLSELLRLSDALGVHVSEFFARLNEERKK